MKFPVPASADSGAPAVAPSVPWSAASRILCFAHHGVGDAINFLPALRSLRQAYPTARLVCTVGSTQVRDLLATQVRVDDWVLFGNRVTGLREILEGRTVPQESYSDIAKVLLRLRRERFDLIVGSYAMRPRTLVWGARLIGTRWLIGECDDPRYEKAFDRFARPRPGVHSLELNNAILGMAGIRVDYERPALRISAEDDASAAAWLERCGLAGRRYAVVHSTAAQSRDSKRWPADRFGRLCDMLATDLGLTPVLIGAADERSQIEAVCASSTVPITVAAGELSLRETAGLIARSALHVGNDSGLLHLAAALDRPTVGIFGPTDAVAFGPYSMRSAVATRRLPCSPCLPLLIHGCGNPVCLTELSVEQVATMVRSVIGSPAPT
jgi:heptosyltransferase III